MKKFAFAALAATTALFAAATADATIITVNGSFTATGWNVYFGAPSAPIDPLFLDYSATFDDSLTYSGDTSVLTINSTNIPYALTFSWGGSTMIIATVGDPSSCTHVVSSFCLFAPTTGVPFFVEQSPADGGGWVASVITDGTPAVPEAATWAMLIAGFGLVGAAARRRKVALAA